MCGIAGIIGIDAQTAEPMVHTMIRQMPYRGPDDHGVWAEGCVAFGHLRLSIIDLSPSGHQPMFSADGRFVLVFNGEIFNYIELRSELKSSGSTFISSSDSEVIIEAYRMWGIDCVKRFNGMWAFALYDRHTKTLFASRDRFGVKPFFYTWENGILRFSSEIKALLSCGKGQPNLQYLYHFFDRRTPLGSDQTVFQNILHLRPSHSFIVRNGEISIHRYWQPHAVVQHSNPDEEKEILRSLVTDAVKLRLRSDVPIGVCLSGGIDSSIIATVIASLGVCPTTFSSVYHEPLYNEKYYIDTVNHAIRATSHTITPTPNDFFTVLEKIVAHHDEPVRMPGVFSHWHVMQCASGHVTVLLDGQGADEIFGGYKELYSSYLESLLADIVLLRRPLEALRDMYACLQGTRMYLGSSLPYAKEAFAKLLPSYIRSILATKRRKQDLFTSDFLEKNGHIAVDDQNELRLLNIFSSALDRDMYRMFVETNLPMLLRYEDRNSMAFSLEARVPFLDYRVVGFAQSLDYRMKIRGYTSKWLLREAFADLLPKEVLERKDKKGFPTPTSEWFRGPLCNEVRSRLSDSPMYTLQIINRAAALRTIDEHSSGRADHERDIFRLLSLDIWLRRYVI